jgi:hypothetical protein
VKRRDREGQIEARQERRAAFVPCVILCVLAAVFFAFHLPYLPRSLEDLDSINFALGVRRFDVAQHQPHPPGYPVYIVLGKAMHALVPDEARALGLLSAAAGALGVLAIGALFRRIDGDDSPVRWTIGATALAVTSPLYWFTAARPLSDAAGLAAAVAVQALTVAATTPRALAAAACAAGLATGIRSQVAWLTLPLLIAKGLQAGGRGLGAWSSALQGADRRRSAALVVALLAFAVGALAWFAPLVIVTGGPEAYWHALTNQGAEDFGNISMLWTTHTVRAAADAVYFRAVAPWATLPVAVVMISLAAIGVVSTAWRDRSALATLATAFVPYAIFDLLFQETFTGRYALPLVIPIAYLAAAALRSLPLDSGLVAAVALAMFDAHVSGTSIAAYSREKAPAFRLLDDMASAARDTPQVPVLAMDRRNALDFRRPIVWVDGAMPARARQLPAPPQHEWLEAVKYWNGGGGAPVWFVVDPKRAAIDLVQHGDPIRYRWPLPYADLVSGARPNEMDWYRVERPEWYVGEGWSLTPEAAGIADAGHRGLAYGSIDAWVGREVAGGIMVIGGRNFDAAPVRLTITAGGKVWREMPSVPPGSFLNLMTVPDARAWQTQGYERFSVAALPPSHLAIEQFDAASDRPGLTRPVFGFGQGWHEPEFNPRTGLRWRWLSERGELRLHPILRPATLHIEGESPRKYFARDSLLVVRYGGRPVFDAPLANDFSLDIPIAPEASGQSPDSIVLQTDQTYVPAERSRRSQDRRRLGLRIFKVEIR